MMMRSLIYGICFMTLGVAGAWALTVSAQVKQLDSEKGSIAFSGPDGQTRTAQIAPDAKILDADGKDLAGGLKSGKLAAGAGVTLTVERENNKPVVHAIRLGKGGAMPNQAAGQNPSPAQKQQMKQKSQAPIENPLPPLDTSNLAALTDLGKDGQYQGSAGGLYPGGSNTRPADHEKAGLALAAQIRPLDAAGQPSPDGKIVLLGIGFSNTVQSFGGFMAAAGQDKTLNPRMVLVNGAHGGRSAFMIQDADDHALGQEYWKTWVPDRLKEAGVAAAQVQAIWLKETDASLNAGQMKSLGREGEYDSPLRMGFPKGAQTLEGELEKIVRIMAKQYPNLKLLFVSSRSYGGWALREGNREPWSYETGFAVKWLIEKQLKAGPSLNYDAAKGKAEAPWMCWGPYLWANGDRARKDGFSFSKDDYAERDRMHYSPQGQKKIGEYMLAFFKTDAVAKPWFLASGAAGQ